MSTKYILVIIAIGAAAALIFGFNDQNIEVIGNFVGPTK